MVKRNGPLIGEEDMPLGELWGVRRGTITGLEQRASQHGREGTTRHGDSESVVAGQGGILGPEDIGPQLLGQSISAGEAEEIGLRGGHGW